MPKAQLLHEMQREMLERLTSSRWLLNRDVPQGTAWVHPTSTPTYCINPADLTACLSAVVGTQPPGHAEPQ